jgi:alpha-ketoglutarate-dependent taurine dioxygenase
MSIGIRQLHPLFVGEIGGVDAGGLLGAETVRALREAIDRYAVLVLRGQDLDDERQMAFAEHFGELELPRSGRADVRRRLRPEMSEALVGFRGDGAHHLTRAAIRAPSRAFPRRRALCTNSKKPR